MRAADHIIESLASKGVTAQVKSQKRVKEIVDITNEVLRQARKRTLPQKEDPLLLGLTSPKPLIGSKKMLDAPPYAASDLSIRPPVDYQVAKNAIISNSNDFSAINRGSAVSGGFEDPEGTFQEQAKFMKNIITRTPTKIASHAAASASNKFDSVRTFDSRKQNENNYEYKENQYTPISKKNAHYAQEAEYLEHRISPITRMGGQVFVDIQYPLNAPVQIPDQKTSFKQQ